MKNKIEDIYKNPSIGVVDGIPVFSNRDRYIANYDKIAFDHIKAMAPGKDNPFIENDLWQKLDASTRELIINYVQPGSRILDIGVGLGRVMAPLSQYQRYGIDISFDYLYKARENGIEVAFSKIEDMPYQDEYFDAVVACDVLEHVLDINECCRNIIRVIKPGGFLIVRVPLKEDLNVYLQEDLAYEYIHLRSFDEASLRLLFGKVFEMTFLEATSVAPFLQGTPRLKLQLLPEETRVRLEVLAESEELSELKKITTISTESFLEWIYNLRDKHHDEYDKVVDDLVLGIDINVVFQKT